MAKKQIPASTRTSGTKTSEQWKEFRETIKLDPQNGSLWGNMYNEYFQERIDSRFLRPVRLIKESTTSQKTGEGFTITAILCILLEHLQAFRDGLIFTTNSGPGLYQYNKSKELFRSFLTTHSPFNEYFRTEDANRFYDDVRCGLLHEAATKGDARIKAEKEGAEQTISEKTPEGFIVYRNAMLSGVECYLESYKTSCLSEGLLSKNLFRKLDELNGVERSLYFAYGSNLWSEQLEKEREIFVHSRYLAELEDYELTFDKKSNKSNNTFANIKKAPGNIVWGVMYEIDRTDFERLKKKYETGYNVARVKVKFMGGKTEAGTFISDPTDTPNPSPEYLDKIIRGATEKGLPNDVIESVRLILR